MRGNLAIGVEKDLCPICQAVVVTVARLTEEGLVLTLVASAETGSTPKVTAK
jgi:hypothetical protein